MGSRIASKTLAKILTTVLVREPGSYGLFWDSNGTMPWKECYWALQEDPSLRFIKETTVRELELLGLEMPFHLETGRLRLKDPWLHIAAYGPMDPPPRLHVPIRTKQYPFVKRHGLRPAGRSYVPLFQKGSLAQRVGLRRDASPLMATVLADEAVLSGIVFLHGGSELYLVEELSEKYVVLPQLDKGTMEVLESRHRRIKEKLREKRMSKGVEQTHLRIEERHLASIFPGKGSEDPGATKDRKRKAKGWKKEFRRRRRRRRG